MKTRSLIVLLGTTASGKSTLGVRLAKRFRGVVISADSRQVYRGLNIGTGKITKREMRSVSHYLLDVASPRSQYSVARYVRDMQRILKKLNPATPVFLVGGSPYYIDAATKPGSFSSVPPNIALRKRLETKTIQHLTKCLTVLDPSRRHTIDLRNKRRLIRAIEIAEATKNDPNTKSVLVPSLRVLKLGMTLPRPILYRTIDGRVDRRIRQGMIAEAVRLHRNGLPWKRMEELGLEYRFMSRYLRGALDKAAMIAQLKTAIHHFAKRQMTWYKRDPDIHWIRNAQEAEKCVRSFLQKRPDLDK